MADPGRASLDADTKEFLFNMEKTAKNILKEHNKRKLLEAARAKADAVRKRAWEVRGAPLQGSRCALSAVGTRLCYGQRQSLWEQQACTGHWALGMKGGLGAAHGGWEWRRGPVPDPSVLPLDWARCAVTRRPTSRALLRATCCWRAPYVPRRWWG
jgi:hypothetical protein